MEIKTAVNRLIRAGNDNSRMWQKLYDAIDDFAKWLGSIFPTNDVNLLPLGYTFQHWPNGQYKIKKMEGSDIIFELNGGANDGFPLIKFHKKENLLLFCRDIECRGFLEELEKMLDNESDILGSSVDKLVDFVLKPSGSPPA